MSQLPRMTSSLDPTREYILPINFHFRGHRIQGWLDSPDDSGSFGPCPIQKSTILIGNILRSGGWKLNTSRDGPPIELTKEALKLGLPCEIRPNVRDTTHAVNSIHWTNRQTQRIVCIVTIRAAPRVLWIEDIFRTRNCRFPHVSEIIKTLYQRDCSILTLRHIFVCQIKHEETLRFVLDEFYPINRTTGQRHYCQMAWDYDSHGYKALLGTRIGKVVAYFILGTYDRGTKRIARIVTSFTGLHTHEKFLQMRFDLVSV
ncbi:hypothetical protein N7462_010370 [Penicillium macrosclerotiorum]|uniref:uncharacterized protein n=1 Tax=Penicillium macrosclerotiorum TaxID=303699 RepID=UPI002547E2DB|nr:uncharacterized protein N7462_010370 [Penicillium macrosclerotiorum]KAJ5669300.1 hypothetical protein N7462_010370 [Penicillium macrosclerotiorum]